MKLYELYGLTIASPFDLPGPPGTGAPDVIVTWADPANEPLEAPVGRLLASVAVGDMRYSIVRTPEGLTLTYPGTCNVFVDGSLSYVRITPAADASRDLAPLLFSGTVLAHLLTVAGACVLHASAVEVGGSATAFVGAPGTGKSTLAALACAAGARLITDDVLRLLPEEGGFACAPGTTELRLRPKSASVADALEGEARPTQDGRLGMTLPDPPRGVRLRALVFPEPVRTQADVTVTPLHPAQAVMRLTMFPRTLGWLDEGVLAQTFRWNADLARTVPAYSALVPWGPPFDPATATRLLSLIGSATPEQSVP